MYGKGQELLMLWALVNQINANLLWNQDDLTEYLVLQSHIPTFIGAEAPV